MSACRLGHSCSGTGERSAAKSRAGEAFAGPGLHRAVPAGNLWLQFSNLQSETTLLLRSAAFLDMSVLVTAQDLLAEAAGKVRQSQP